jgi:glucosamine-6-phosphate deaminase
VILRKFSDYETLSREAANMVADQIRANPASVLGLAAGKTPIGTYNELVRLHRESRLDFSRVVFFNLDEYWGLPESDPQSFGWFLNHHLIRHIHLPSGNIHFLNGIAAESSCETFETAIREAGGIDLQILGIGRNGHIGFNEPDSPFDSRTRPVVLAHEGPPGTPRTAVTMGIATILDARRILLLAAGDKAGILRKALEGPVTETVPASVLQRHADVTVLHTCDL